MTLIKKLRVISICLVVCGSTFLASTAVAKKKRNPQSETWSPPQFEQIKSLGYNEKTFATPPGLEQDVQFWIKIYTQYTTQQGIFHLSGETTEILGDIDLSQVFANPKWGPIRKEKEAEIIVKRQKHLLAQKYKIKDVRKIRLQMGLKDRMLNAIRVSGEYLPMMEREFKKQKIPLELTRLVFVESSFNIQAQSKVGASGLWQIMPSLGKKFKYINDGQDLRNHPYYSTQLAARILKENYQILKSWPLAVTAYNHGVGSLRKLVKKYKSNDIAYLIENVSSKKSFGFASRSFYATYLAALQVEKNANLYFPEPIYREESLAIRYFKLAKPYAYDKVLEAFKGDEKKLKALNPHLKKKYLKAGKLLPAQIVVNIPGTQPIRVGELKELSL